MSADLGARIESLTATDDAFLQGATGYDTDQLRVEDGSRTRTSYVRFDTSSVGAVDSVDLELTVGSDSGQGNVVVARGSDSDWSDATLTAANAPVANGELVSVDRSFASGQTVTLALPSDVLADDVLDLVITIDGSGADDVSFISSEGGSGPTLVLGSRVSTPTPDPAPSPTPDPAPTPDLAPTPAAEGSVSPEALQAEDFQTASGIQIVENRDGGDHVVGYVNQGDSTSYSIDVADAGVVATQVRVSSAASGSSIDFTVGGTSVGSVNVPFTNGWNNYRTVSTDLTFPTSGENQTLRLEFNGRGGYLLDINWLTFGDADAPVEPDPVEPDPVDPDPVDPDPADNPWRNANTGPTFTPGAGGNGVNPGNGWGDSYSVNGRCYMDTTFDHAIGGIVVDTPVGPRTIREVYEVMGDGPGAAGNPIYNDIQCGNGPANNAGDEDVDQCPGRVDQGASGCSFIGPLWELDLVYGID